MGIIIGRLYSESLGIESKINASELLIEGISLNDNNSNLVAMVNVQYLKSFYFYYGQVVIVYGVCVTNDSKSLPIIHPFQVTIFI